LLIALADHFWDLKANLRLAVRTFTSEPGMRRVEVRDEGSRLRVNGDGYGAETRLEVEHERVRAIYSRHPPRGTDPRTVTLRIDVRDDALVSMDGRGCIVEVVDRPRVLVEPLFRRLATPPKPRRRPPLW
jgi:hypothetical protein